MRCNKHELLRVYTYCSVHAELIACFRYCSCLGYGVLSAWRDSLGETDTYKYILKHTYTPTYIHTYIQTYLHHTYMYTYTYIHTYIHKHIHTYIHIYMSLIHKQLHIHYVNLCSFSCKEADNEMVRIITYI